MSIHTYIHTYIHRNVMYAYIYRHIYNQCIMFDGMYTHTYIYIYKCNAYIHTYIYIYIYIYIYNQYIMFHGEHIKCGSVELSGGVAGAPPPFSPQPPSLLQTRGSMQLMSKRARIQGS